MKLSEDYEIEQRGYDEGINPYFGEWSQRFDFKPVSYQSRGDDKKIFKSKLQSQLKNKYVFIEFIKLEVTLYLNEQKFMETPEYGDLDNYAKIILDAIKGKNGLLIDDCQVQRLDISWMDTPHHEYFEISIKSRPDEFMQKSLKLYEMLDGLYYPLSHLVWTKEGIKESLLEHKKVVMSRLSEMTRTAKAVRHEMRQEGLNPLESFWNSSFFKPSLLGFHKTRVIDSGFDLINLKEWSNE